jgi:hypothetical protein
MDLPGKEKPDKERPPHLVRHYYADEGSFVCGNMCFGAGGSNSLVEATAPWSKCKQQR